MGAVLRDQAGRAGLGAVAALPAGAGLGAVRPDVVPLARAAVLVRDQAEGLGRRAHGAPPGAGLTAGGGSGRRSSRTLM